MSPPPKGAPGTSAPFVIAYAEHGVLRLVTREAQNQTQTERLGLALQRALRFLEGLDHNPELRLLFDARKKGFADLAAQKAMSVGIRETLAGFSIQRAAIASEKWRDAAVDEGVQGFDSIEEAWRFLTETDLPNPQVLLLGGGVGAGKTTLSAVLCDFHGALYFGMDDWLRRLFFDDRDASVNYEWFWERAQRVQRVMQERIEDAALRQTPVLCDVGLMEERQRVLWNGWLEKSGLRHLFYFVDVEPDVRWERVQARNRAQPKIHLQIDRPIFDFMEEKLSDPGSAAKARIFW
jgi:predicted kinase